MLLTELLDAPYKFELISGDQKGDALAHFKDDSGERVIVNFEYWGGPELVIVDFKRKGSFDMLNDTSKEKHEAVKIMSTVIATIKKYVASDNPKFVSFSSKNSEDSRSSLYNRLSSKIASSIGYVKVDDDDVDNVKHHVLPSWWKNKLKMSKEHKLSLFARKDTIES